MVRAELVRMRIGLAKKGGRWGNKEAYVKMKTGVACQVMSRVARSWVR